MNVLKIFNYPSPIEVAMKDVAAMLNALSVAIGFLVAGLLVVAYLRRRRSASLAEVV